MASLDFFQKLTSFLSTLFFLILFANPTAALSKCKSPSASNTYPNITVPYPVIPHPVVPPSSSSSASSITTTTTAATTTTGTTTPYQKATWNWSTAPLIQNNTRITEFLAFAKAQNLTAIYLQVDVSIPNAVYRSFVRRCGDSGVTVEALMGNVKWITGEEGEEPSLDEMLGWTESYMGNVTDEGEKLRGVHLDVEPWDLDDFWSSNSTRDAHMTSWQTLISRTLAFARSNDLALALDLPFWAYQIPVSSTSTTSSSSSYPVASPPSSSSDPTTLDLWAIRTVDSVTFMTYRDSAPAVADIARRALAAARALHSPVWLAVETCAPAAGRGIQLETFAGKSGAQLGAALETLQAGFAGVDGFGGLAVHERECWMGLA